MLADLRLTYIVLRIFVCSPKVDLSGWFEITQLKFITGFVQGAILPGYHADIVVWKPEAQFHLDDSHPVYHKHRVRFFLTKKESSQLKELYNSN